MDAVWNFNAGKGEEGTIKTMKSSLSLSVRVISVNAKRRIRTRSQQLISDV